MITYLSFVFSVNAPEAKSVEERLKSLEERVKALEQRYESTQTEKKTSAVGLTKDRACELAKSFLASQGISTRQCAYFEPSKDQAFICADTHQVFLQRYSEEGWKAMDRMLGSTRCGK